MITEEIERDIKRLMPPYITVQTSIRFAQGGSIVIEGSVVLLSWVGGIAFAAAQEAAKQHLSTFIKTSVQRVLGQILPPEGVNLNSLNVTTTGKRDDGGEMFTPGGDDSSNVRSRSIIDWHSGRLIKILILMTLAILFLELGRMLIPYVTISGKPEVERAKKPIEITYPENESDRIKKTQQALKERGTKSRPH